MAADDYEEFLPSSPSESPDERKLLVAEEILRSHGLHLWRLLKDSEKSSRRDYARKRCKELRQDLHLKDKILAGLQKGVLIPWLVDHQDVLRKIVPRSAQHPDAGVLMKDGRQSNRMSKIATRWWDQYIVPASEQDQEAEAEARAAPGLVELYLYDTLGRDDYIDLVCPHDRLEIRSSDAHHRPIVVPADRVEIHMDPLEGWSSDDVETMRHRPVVVVHGEERRKEAQMIARRLRGVAATVRLVDAIDLEDRIKNELAACELWRCWLCRCQSDNHWTIGDEHFQKYCKMHQKVRRLEQLRDYEGRKQMKGRIGRSR